MFAAVTFYVLFVHPTALPTPPSRLTISEVTATSVKLSWQPSSTHAGAEQAESYIIQYKRKYGTGTTYDEISDITGSEYIVHGLSAYTVYEFHVVAVNNIGRSNPTPPVDVTTGELG